MIGDFEDDGASFRARRQRVLDTRYGPIIEARRSGVRGWWDRSSPTEIYVVSVIGMGLGVAFIIFACLAALIIWDAIGRT